MQDNTHNGERKISLDPERLHSQPATGLGEEPGPFHLLLENVDLQRLAYGGGRPRWAQQLQQHQGGHYLSNVFESWNRENGFWRRTADMRAPLHTGSCP